MVQTCMRHSLTLGGVGGVFRCSYQCAVPNHGRSAPVAQIRPAHWAGFSRAVQQSRFTKDAALQTSHALTKDGRTSVVELAAATIWSPSGQVRGIMAIGRDVTEHRARELVQREHIARLEQQVAARSQRSAKAGEGGNASNGWGMESRP